MLTIPMMNIQEGEIVYDGSKLRIFEALCSLIRSEGGEVIQIRCGIHPAWLHSALREANRMRSVRGRDLTSVLEP